MENNAADEEAPVLVQANVEEPAAAVPVHADAVQVRIPEGWNPYDSPEEYVPPENPYDTNIVDPEEVTTVCSPSPVLHSFASSISKYGICFTIRSCGICFWTCTYTVSMSRNVLI